MNRNKNNIVYSIYTVSVYLIAKWAYNNSGHNILLFILPSKSAEVVEKEGN